MTNVFDPYNPPRFCPSCAQKGVKSKVKKMKVDPRGDKFIIMCKNDQCPWPLSVMSVDEVNRVVDAVTGEKVDAGEAAVKDPVKAMCALVSGKDSYPVVPQVKVGENGELVLDESSLYIKTTSQSESLDSTNSTWRKKKSHKGWSDILISDSTEDAKEEGGKGGRKSKKKRSRKRYRNRGYYDSSEDEDRNADILTRKSPASQTNKVEIQEEIQMKKIMRPKGLHKYRLNTKSKERLDKTVGEASEPNLSQIVAYGGTQGMSISSTHSKEDEESQGGNLTSTTSQDDLDRHQRDSICPSVRPKATLQKGPDDPHPHTSIQTQVPLTATGSPLPGTKPNNQNKSSQLLNKETDHIPTPYNLDELFMISNEAEMKQCIGDHIYPYVLKKLPPGIARKITGMIINLPKEQLATGIHSQQTLDRMIKEARETLSETYGDTYEQSIPDNDTYSAMFHEVMSSPAKKQRTQGENAPARSLCMSISSTHSKEDEESQGGKINDSSRFEICFEKGFYNPNRHDNNDEEFAPLKLGVAGGLDTKKSCVEKSSDVLLQESIRDLLQCCSTLPIMDDVGEAKEENVEYVPTEQELREDLEGLVFGGYLPKVMRELTPPRTGNSNESSLSQLVNIEDIAFVPKQPRAQVNENYLRKKTFGLEKYFGETCTSNMPSENFEKTHISSKPSEKSKKKRPRKRYRNRGYYDSSEDEDRNAISSKPSEKFTKFDQMFKRSGEKKVTGVASDKEEVKTKGACSPNSKQYSDDNRIVQTSGLSESSLTDVKGKNVDVNVSEDNVDELLDDSVRIIDGNNNEQEGDNT